MMDEMANGKALFAERNGERKTLFCRTKRRTKHFINGTKHFIARYEIFYFEDEMANESISIRNKNRNNFVPGNTIFRTMQ